MKIRFEETETNSVEWPKNAASPPFLGLCPRLKVEVNLFS